MACDFEGAAASYELGPDSEELHVVQKTTFRSVHLCGPDNH